jgi:hypothetical protein
MKYLKRFNEDIGIEATISNGNIIPNEINDDNIIYNNKWENYLPETFSIVNGEEHTFKKGNIMINSDMFQITYDNVKKEWGYPDTLEFDIYTVKDNSNNKIRLDIDITVGDLIVSEFNIESPNVVNVIQNTTYRSKFNTSEIFALTDESLKQFVDFLNKFNGMKLDVTDFKFLDKYDDYNKQ